MASKDIYRPEITYVWYPDPLHEGFERCQVSMPGYRDPGPKNGAYCGIHGMELLWLLRGPKGAIDFSIATNWLPGEVGTSWRWSDEGKREFARTRSTHDLFPSGMGIGIHALTKQYEDQYSRDDCMLFGEPRKCYVDRMGLLSDELMVEWSKEGDRVVWERLKELHDDLI